MEKGKFFTVFAIILTFSILLSNYAFASNGKNAIIKFENGRIINAELAITLEEKATGLMGRESLGRDQGMLFIFDYPGNYSFWMKNMNFAIDIIWISSDFKIVDITKNAKPCKSNEKCKSYASREKAKYVVEVPSGFSDENNLAIGQRIEIEA